MNPVDLETDNTNKNNIIILISLVIAASVYLMCIAYGQSIQIAMTLCVALVCVIWWIFEPVPIPVTSLLPLAAFQITGVLGKDQVAAAYGSPIILLLLGGFILSKAMESSGAHKRLAIYMINLFGGNNHTNNTSRLIFGFMCTAALLSMWISNTATTLMLLPVAVAVIHSSDNKAMAGPLMLGIAWAASIGGMGTPIGTPPNLVFMQVYEESVGKSISFLDWMLLAVPVVLIMVPLAAWVLTRNISKDGKFDLPQVGLWGTYEKRVIAVFIVTALAWITRKEPFGGWSNWFNLPNANDASVALIAVIAMFIIPSGNKNTDKEQRLLNWETASQIPWGTLLLFGGGLCLAKAFVVSGLSEIVGQNLSSLTTLNTLLMLLLLCLIVTFLTETTSNTASSVLLMPILASVALASSVDPMLLMVPAVISASCAFMLPVATAPNSIAYSTGTFRTRYMARKGLILNLAGALVISSYCYLRL